MEMEIELDEGVDTTPVLESVDKAVEDDAMDVSEELSDVVDVRKVLEIDDEIVEAVLEDELEDELDEFEDIQADPTIFASTETPLVPPPVEKSMTFVPESLGKI